ncbi:MAG: hypothetical protein K6U88_17045 [Dehalococcoidia bacterium]|nr:hypothetical protein [Dehalococcoidia bacterium]
MARQAMTFRARTSEAGLELTLTVVALLAAAITPNVFVAGGLHLVPASALAKYVLLLAVVIQLAILFYARGAGYSRLANRLITGIWVGVVATTGLDVVRQPGTFFGYLPHDEARMAGELILGGGHGHAAGPTHGDGTPQTPQPHGQAEKHAPAGPHGQLPVTKTEPSHAATTAKPKAEHGAPRPGHEPMPHGAGADHVGAADFVGYAYHYWNGASFAVLYALVFGRTPWWGPLLYALLFIETGMLIFMQAAMPPLTWGVVLVSLLAHVVYGVVLGVLFARFLRDRGSILELLTAPKLRQRTA